MVMICLTSALDPCMLYVLDVSNLSNTSTTGNSPVYQTMNQLMNNLTQVFQTPGVPVCASFGAIVYPGSYDIGGQYSLDGIQQTYSLKFNTSNPTPSPGDPTTTFSFNNQASLVLQNFASIEFQNINLAFGNQSTNSLAFVNCSDLIILNANTTESQANTGADFQIKILDTTNLTINIVNMNSVLSPNFFEINNPDTSHQSIASITNWVIEYAVTSASQTRFILLQDPCAVFINSTTALTIKNLSVVSPSNLTTSFISSVLYIVNSTNTSISGMNISNLVSNYYGYWCAFESISNLVLKDIIFAENTIYAKNFGYGFLNMFEVNNISIQNLTIANNSIQISKSLQWAFCFFNFTWEEVMFGEVTVQDVFLKNTSQTSFFSASGEFLFFNATNVSATNLNLLYGSVFLITTAHENEEAFKNWFLNGKTSQSFLKNLQFENITVQSASIIRCAHSIYDSPFTGTTYGESVNAYLTNITFSQITASQQYGEEYGLIDLDGAKGFVSQIALLNFTSAYLSFIRSELASLITDNLNVTNANFSNAWMIQQLTTYVFEIGQIIPSYQTMVGLPLYRVLSIQNSSFQNIGVVSCDLISGMPPFFLFANNIITNVTMTDQSFDETALIDLDYDSDLANFVTFNISVYLSTNDTFVGPLVGSEITGYANKILELGSRRGYLHLISNNSFSFIGLDQDVNLFSMIKGPQDEFFVLFENNNFTDVSGTSLNNSFYFTDVSNITISQNQFMNFDSFSGILEIQSALVTNITQNQFNNCTGYGIGGGGTLITFTPISNTQTLNITNNNFTRAFVNGTDLLSLEIPRNFQMSNNNFISCTLSVGIPSSLITILDDPTLGNIALLPATFNSNVFNDTRVMTLKNSPKKSMMLRIETDYVTINISSCIFSNINSASIHNLAAIDIYSPAVIINNSTVFGFSGGIWSFGNFIKFEAANISLSNCLIGNINFSYPNIIQDNLIYVLTFDENDISFNITDTNFTNITLLQTTFFNGGGIDVLNLTLNHCLFTQVTWLNNFLALTASPLTLSFIDTMFNLSELSDQFSEPTGIWITQPNNTLFFLRSTIIMGVPRTGSFVTYNGASGGLISFSQSSVLSLQSYNKISLNQTGNQSIQTSRFLQGIDNSDYSQTQIPLMKLLDIQGNLNLTFEDSLIDLGGVTTPPPIFASTSNFGLNIQNSSFQNLMVVPDTVNSQASCTDYYDTYGKYLGGVVNVLINHLSSGIQNIEILVNGSSFSNITSNSTGAFSIYSDNPVIPFSFFINSSSFTNLTAKYGPVAALLLPYNDEGTSSPGFLSITNSSINDTNAASLGGAIFNNMTHNISLNLLNSSNTVMNSANNLIYDTTGTSAHWNLSTQYNDKIVRTPAALSYIVSLTNQAWGIFVTPCVNETGILCLQNASSYAFNHINLKISILDEAYIPFPDPSQRALLTITCPKKNYYSPSYQCSNGTCFIDKVDFTLSGQAFQEYELNLTYTSEYASLTNFIRIKLRECLPGEYNDTTVASCEYCTPGNYSLQPTMPCNPCPIGATCEGGSNLNLVANYWRANTSTDKIYHCNDTQGRCLGNYNSDCLEGYTGPLCLQCDYDKFYGASSSGCQECPSNMALLIFTRLIIWALPFLYAVYVFTKQKAINERILEEQHTNELKIAIKQAIYIDLLITYSQIMSIVWTFQGGMREILSFLGGGGGGSGTPILFFPESCLYIGYSWNCIGCISATVALLTPILQWIILSLIYLAFMYRFKLTWKRVRRFLLIGVTLYLLYYPSVCDKLIKLLHCSNLGIEGGNKFVASDPNISCSSPSYVTFANYVAIPALAIWGLVIPALIIISLRYFRQHPKGVRQIFGQLINPYKGDKYYWALGVLMLKLGLVTASNFAEGDIKFRALSMITMLYLYKWLEGYLEPYANFGVVTGVRISLYAYITTVFFSYFYTDNTPAMKVVCVLVIVVINLAGLGYILSFIVSSMYETVVAKIKGLRERFFSKKNTVQPESFDEEKTSQARELEITQSCNASFVLTENPRGDLSVQSNETNANMNTKTEENA